MPDKVVFLGGFVGFFLFGLFLLVCFQILDLLCLPEEALQGSDRLRVLFSRCVMKRLVLIMIRPSINAEVPADNIPKADVLGLYPVFVKQELAVFIYLKRFIGEDIRIQVMLQQGGCIFGLLFIKPDTFEPCFLFSPRAILTQIDDIFFDGLPAETVHGVPKAEGEIDLVFPDKNVRIAVQIIDPSKNIIDDHKEGALADRVASGLCAEDSI